MELNGIWPHLRSHYHLLEMRGKDTRSSGQSIELYRNIIMIVSCFPQILHRFLQCSINNTNKDHNFSFHQFSFAISPPISDAVALPIGNH